MKTGMHRHFSVALLGATIFMSGCATTGDDLPAVTSDGLTRIESKKVDAVYWQEGATLQGYDSVAIVEAPVAFRKDWMRDYNRNRMSTGDRVRESDMERIKSELSSAFKEQFSTVLNERGYTVVDGTGDNVLLLRPAIVDLDVTAPDLRSATRSTTFTADPGEMTLYLELYDSVTGDKIGEVADRQRGMDSGRLQWSNSASNRAEANRILRRWANLLADALDEANNRG
jgi:hypothetical protein